MTFTRCINAFFCLFWLTTAWPLSTFHESFDLGEFIARLLAGGLSAVIAFGGFDD